MFTTYAEHTRSRNIEATIRGNHKTTVYPVVMVTIVLNILGPEIWNPVVLVATYTEHTRSRNMEATFRGNHNTIVCQGVMIRKNWYDRTQLKGTM